MITEKHTIIVSAYIAHDFIKVKDGSMVRLPTSPSYVGEVKNLVNKLGLNTHIKLFRENFIEVIMDAISSKFNCLVHHTIDDEDYLEFYIDENHRHICFTVKFYLYLDQQRKYGGCINVGSKSQFNFSCFKLAHGDALSGEFASFNNDDNDISDITACLNTDIQRIISRSRSVPGEESQEASY